MKSDWDFRPLGAVCEVLDHLRKPVTKKDRLPGPYPYYGATGIVDYVGDFLFDEPLVLIGEDGAKWGSGDATAFAITGPSWVNNHAHVVRPDRANVLDEWLVHYLVHQDLSRYVSGLTVPKPNQGSLREIPIPLPALSEQRRIVAILDEAFEGIATAKAHAEQNIRSAQSLFGSYMQAALKRSGEGWIEKPLGDIGKVSMCKRIFKEQTRSRGDIPFYKIGTFGKKADAYIPIEIYSEYRRKYPFPNKGDVLISAAGTIGRCVVYDGEDAYFQDSNIVWIANDQTQVLNHYLYHFYSSCEWSSTRGATISRLYNDNLRQLVVTFPNSLHEQHRIATQLDDLAGDTQRLESICREKLFALDELKQSLLHQAFSGQL